MGLFFICSSKVITYLYENLFVNGANGTVLFLQGLCIISSGTHSADFCGILYRIMHTSVQHHSQEVCGRETTHVTSEKLKQEMCNSPEFSVKSSVLHPRAAEVVLAVSFIFHPCCRVGSAVWEAAAAPPWLQSRVLRQTPISPYFSTVSRNL